MHRVCICYRDAPGGMHDGSACAEGQGYVHSVDFHIEVEERLVQALAEVFIETSVSVEECALDLGIVADVNPASAP